MQKLHQQNWQLQKAYLRRAKRNAAWPGKTVNSGMSAGEIQGVAAYPKCRLQRQGPQKQHEEDYRFCNAASAQEEAVYAFCFKEELTCWYSAGSAARACVLVRTS